MTEMTAIARKEEAKKKGMCQSCFIRKALPGETKCWVCKQREGKRRERRAERRAEATASGMCRVCFIRPVEPGKTKCRGCLSKRSEWKSSPRNKAKEVERVNRIRDVRRSKDRASGLCTFCHVMPADPGFITCSACREKRSKRTRAYYDLTRESSRERRRDAAREARRELRKKVVEHYGGKCACCGFDQYPALTIDHIDGGGAQHRREINNNLIRWLVSNDYPEGYQVLCWNCNCVKGMYGSCTLEHTI